MLEFYDFTLYGFFVAILSPLFFPASDPYTSLISGFGVFAVGFVTRPLGAILFGHIGDKYGRKNALTLSIILMALPTLMIGCLPTYQQIGLAAPILLMLARLIQGICTGGEYNGAGIFIVEHTKTNKKGFYGSILSSSGAVGGLLATLIGSFFTQKGFPDWSWRIPFILGGALAAIGFYLRKNVSESPEFLAIEAQSQSPQVPILDILKNYFPSVFFCFLIGSNTTLVLYLVLVYVNSTLLIAHVLDSSSMMLINSLMLGVSAFFMLFMGKLSDRIGHKRLMTISLSLIFLLAVPASYIFSSKNLYLIIPIQALLLTLNVGFVAPSNAFMATFFPPQYRYSGVAFGYTMGLSLVGGTAPYVVSWLVKITNNPHINAFYIMLGCLIGIIALALGKQKIKTSQEKFAFSVG